MKLNTDQQEILKKGIRRLWLTWGSMLFCLFIYVKIGPTLNPTLDPIPTDDFSMAALKISLYCISAILLVFSRYFRIYIMKQQSEKQESRYTQRAEKTNSHPAVIKYGTAVMVSLALAESIGLFGFVLFLLSNDFQALYVFNAVSAIAMLYHRPRMQELQQVTSAMK